MFRMRKPLWITLLVASFLLIACSNINSIDSGTTCKKIAFVLYSPTHSIIYSACPDGSQLAPLTETTSDSFTPAWSPDGTQLAFASNRSGSSQIFIMNADGSEPRQLTSDEQNDMPIWVPGGEQIAFRTTDGKGLWWWREITISTKATAQLNKPSFDFFYPRPAWSPDGKQIAYMSLVEQAQRNDGASQIHVKNADGTNDKALTADTWTNLSPIWSPDGTKIAFLSERDGTYNVYALYVMNANGSFLQRLTQPVYDAGYIPTWSPDGKEIAINSPMSNTPGNIDIVNVVTGTKRELLKLTNGETVSSPSWQP